MIDLENISFDHCIKCTVCTAYCPVARVTSMYPGPKQSGPDTERLRIKDPALLDESLKYCSNCKRCEIACPSGVKIADIIQKAKWEYSRNGFRLRDWLFSHTDLMGGFATNVSGLTNAINRFAPIRYVMDAGFKIPRQRRLPIYAAGTFRRWFDREAPDQSAYEQKVVYFHGCYVNYNDHELGRSVVRALNALGVGVRLCPERCCGVPQIANGFIPAAGKAARHNIAALEAATEGTADRIVSASSTCALALKHEYPNLLGLDNGAIAGRIDYLTKFLIERIEADGLPDMKPLGLHVAYHAPCHLERMGGIVHTIELLRRLPGVRLGLLHSECCGISGTYGFKKEYYDISQAVAGELVERIDAIKPDVVVTDCETCKWQIEMNTPYEVVHPVSLVARALSV